MGGVRPPRGQHASECGAAGGEPPPDQHPHHQHGTHRPQHGRSHSRKHLTRRPADALWKVQLPVLAVDDAHF